MDAEDRADQTVALADRGTATYAGVGTAYLVTEQSGAESSLSGAASSGETDSDSYLVHGVALGSGDVTVGKSGVKKYWPASELREAARTLEGKPLVRDHLNTTEGTIGTVTHAEYVEEMGVVYEAEIAPQYEDLAADIQSGLLDVSIRAYHREEAELDERDDGALVVEDIHFDNLSVVPNGASPSNTATAGPIEQMDSIEASATVPAELSGPDADAHTVATLSRTVDTSSEALNAQLSMETDDTPTAGDAYATDDVSEDYPYEPDHIYETRADAEAAGEELGCGSAAHELAREGSDETYYAPCATMVEYTDATEETETMMAPESVPEEEAGAGDCGCGMDTSQLSADTVAQLAPRGVTEYEGTMYGIAPDEHSDENTEHPGDYKYPMTSCTGEDSVEAAWNLRGHGHYDIEQETLEDRIQRAAEAMGCDPSIVGMEGDSFESGHRADGRAEAADIDLSRGDWAEWDTRNSTEHGKVTEVVEADEEYDHSKVRGDRGVEPDPDDPVVLLRMYKHTEEDGGRFDVDTGRWHPIDGGLISHKASSVRSWSDPPDESEVGDATVELASGATLGRSNTETYEDFSEGDWVQWYPDATTNEHGAVVAVDTDSSEVEIQPWDQDADGKWKESDRDTVTKPLSEVDPWGNFPREQEEFADDLDPSDPRLHKAQGPQQRTGSDKNPEGSAASASSVADTRDVDDLEEISYSDQVDETLENKVEEHNEEYGDDEGKRVTKTMLKKVYRRGAGAYSDTHREGMTRNQWAMARVNAFLYLVRNGNPENDQYTQDNDLLPDEHPRATDGSSENSARPPSVVSTHVAELERPSASMDELDAVYSDWDDAVNMTASELEQWAENPCSREASVDPEAVIERNMRLLETDKSDWDTDDIADAKRTISFISRMSSAEMTPDDRRDGPHGCPSEWAISLLNWAYNPFDSVPDVPDQMEDEMAMNTDINYETPNGAVWFEVPDSGDTVTTPLNIVTGAHNFQVESYKHDAAQGHGHLHVLINEPFVEPGEKIPMDETHKHLVDGEKKFEIECPPGEHTLRLQAGDSNHYAYDMKDEIDLTVIDPESASDGAEMARGSLGSDADVVRAELAGSVEIHEPEYEETTTEGEFTEPMLDSWDFDSWDEMSETEQEVVSEHFVCSESGFPPESWDDLMCPVVEPDGTLHAGALEDALEMLAEHDDLSMSALEPIAEIADEEFDMDDALPEMEEMSDAGTLAQSGAGRLVVATRSTDSSVERTATLTELSMIDYEPATPEELGDELDEPVVVEQEDLESLAEKAERADSVEEELEALSEKLDERDEATEIVESLSEEERELLGSETETAVLEAERAEMIDDVVEIYADELATYTPFTADELAAKFDPLDLRARVEEHDEASLAAEIGAVEPEPDAGADSNTDVAEASAEAEDGSDEESDARAELASQLERQGWTRQAEKVRSGELELTR